MAEAYYYNIRLLMNMEGANNGTVFTDYSVFQKSWTVGGNAKTSNAAVKYGSTSLYVDGSSWIEAAGGGESNLGAGDFTIEFWIKTASSNACIIDTYIAYAGWSIEVKSGGIAFYTGISEARPIWTTTPLVNDNNWHHVALCRENTALRCFIDGTLAGSNTSSDNFNKSGAKIGLGAFVNRNLPAYNLTGYIDDVRIIAGVALYTKDFTPPGSLDVSTLPLTLQVATPPLPLVQIGSSVLSSRAEAPMLNLRDDIWGGNGRISGTTKVKGTPNSPVRRRVRLIRERDAMAVRESWSDPVTGAYSFDNIDANYKYTVLSFDHDHNHRAVIADNLTPELMP